MRVPVPGTVAYEVDDEGGIWSRVSGEWVKLAGVLDQTGYRMVTIWFNGKKTRTSFHRVILLSFVGPCPPGMQGLHWDDNKLNNRIDNLRWGTPKENHADASRNGRKRRGEQHHNAKVNAGTVVKIRLRLAAGEPGRSIARDFGVSRNCVRDIEHNITWRHV